MSNRDKLNSAIGKLLDQINESIEKKEVPNTVTLEALKILVEFTSLNYQIEQPFRQ